MAACEMIHVSPGEHGMGEERVCGKPATHHLEGGHPCCTECARGMEMEGIVVFDDPPPPPVPGASEGDGG